MTFWLCLCRERRPLDYGRLDGYMYQFKGSSTRYIFQPKKKKKFWWKLHITFTLWKVEEPCWVQHNNVLLSPLYSIGAALELKRLKLSAHCSGNIAEQEMEKGNSSSNLIPYYHIHSHPWMVVKFKSFVLFNPLE